MPADVSTMSCPVCQGSFREVLREGILIDVCTQCRGVWLDRGELEKLLSLSRGPEVEQPPQPRQAPPPHYPQQPTYQQPPQQPYREPERYYKRDDDDDDDYKRRHGYGDHDKYRYKKKRGFDLGDIFDFG